MFSFVNCNNLNILNRGEKKENISNYLIGLAGIKRHNGEKSPCGGGGTT